MALKHADRTTSGVALGGSVSTGVEWIVECVVPWSRVECCGAEMSEEEWHEVDEWSG